MAHKIKIATMIYQSEKKGMIPYKQLTASPQTNNKNFNFNEKVDEVLLKIEANLCSDGHHFSFLNTANDSVSCDSKFVLNELILFLEEEQSF